MCESAEMIGWAVAAAMSTPFDPGPRGTGLGRFYEAGPTASQTAGVDRRRGHRLRFRPPAPVWQTGPHVDETSVTGWQPAAPRARRIRGAARSVPGDRPDRRARPPGRPDPRPTRCGRDRGRAAGRQPGPASGRSTGTSAGPERSFAHWSFNRGKRSVVLDLAGSDDDRARLRGARRRRRHPHRQRRAGPAGSAGASEDEHLAALNPALVHVSITPFGQTGPEGRLRRQRPGAHGGRAATSR